MSGKRLLELFPNSGAIPAPKRVRRIHYDDSGVMHETKIIREDLFAQHKRGPKPKTVSETVVPVGQEGNSGAGLPLILEPVKLKGG